MIAATWQDHLKQLNYLTNYIQMSKSGYGGGGYYGGSYGGFATNGTGLSLSQAAQGVTNPFNSTLSNYLTQYSNMSKSGYGGGISGRFGSAGGGYNGPY